MIMLLARVCLAVLLLFTLPQQARAIPAITCHCFTDRSYDPGRPNVADPYFLATAQNSFFAVIFNVERKAIVMKKQQGVSADDLWVAYRLAATAKVTPESLLQARSTRETWSAVQAQLRLSPGPPASRFATSLKARAASPRLAEAVVDDLLLQYRLLGEGELAALRQLAATNQELILGSIIAARKKQPVKKVFLEVKSGAKSWGALLQEAKIDTREIEQEIASLLKAPR